MERRPRYSTGFRIMLVGGAIAALGVLCYFTLSHTLGLVLLVAGGVPAIWYCGYTPQSQWEKTWPDDFPILARLAGKTPDPTRWERTPTWWETAPPLSRLKGSLVLIAAGIGLLLWGLHGGFSYHDVLSYGSDSRSTVIGAMSIFFGLWHGLRAWNDL